MIRCGTGPAEAPLASDSDNPAAAPSVGTAFLKRLRFADCLTCGMQENLSLRARSRKARPLALTRWLETGFRKRSCSNPYVDHLSVVGGWIRDIPCECGGLQSLRDMARFPTHSATAKATSINPKRMMARPRQCPPSDIRAPLSAAPLRGVAELAIGDPARRGRVGAGHDRRDGRQRVERIVTLDQRRFSLERHRRLFSRRGAKGSPMSRPFAQASPVLHHRRSPPPINAACRPAEPAWERVLPRFG
jgi:hypothetical protein